MCDDLKCCSVLQCWWQIPSPPSMGSAGRRCILIFLSVLVPWDQVEIRWPPSSEVLDDSKFKYISKNVTLQGQTFYFRLVLYWVLSFWLGFILIFLFRLCDQFQMTVYGEAQLQANILRMLRVYLLVTLHLSKRLIKIFL